MLAELNRREWLELRKSGIGGSDAGAICGLNPFSSAIKVYQDKTSTEVSDFDNEAMRQGRDLEDYVARRFSEETGLKVRRSNVMYRSVSHPYMIADVDRMIVGEDAGLECKTASAYNADKWKDGAIPAHYAIQCYHYMAVTGRRNWYIAVLLLGQGFRYAKLTWDDEIIHSLIQLEDNFWNNHVLAHVMPDPDGSKVCDEVLNQYFHIARKDSMIPLIGFDEKLDRRAELGRLIEKMQQEQHQIDQEIKLYMGDHELASSDRYQVAWSNVESTRLDAKRLKADLPDIYRSYGCHSISRRFSVRSA
jgi:putative phage-type endonuclease